MLVPSGFVKQHLYTRPGDTMPLILLGSVVWGTIMLMDNILIYCLSRGRLFNGSFI